MSRLELIKQLIESERKAETGHYVTIEDIDWLIQQVDLYKECQADAIELHKERNRYKQALEFYSDKENYRTVVETEKEIMFLRMSKAQEDSGKIARQAIKEESE